MRLTKVQLPCVDNKGIRSFVIHINTYVTELVKNKSDVSLKAACVKYYILNQLHSTGKIFQI